MLLVTSGSGESSFSKMKFTENRLHITMCHDRLSHLVFMSIEYDVFRGSDLNKLIQDFASVKSHKVPGLWIKVLI